MNAPSFKQFMVGFLHPGLHGGYVAALMIAALSFGVSFAGHGSWFRVGGFYLVGVPLLLLGFATVMLLTCVLTRVWNRCQRDTQNVRATAPDNFLFVRLVVVTVLLLIIAVRSGGELRATKAREACRDAGIMIAELEKLKVLQGSYPSNVDDLTAWTTLGRSYRLYHGTASDDWVDWNPFELARAGLSVFVTSERYQLVVPIEKASPITFSSFYVYEYNSETRKWRKTLLHWSLLGAYID